MGKIVFGFNILSRIKELPLFRWISFCIVFWGLPIGLALNECEGILKEYELEAKSKIDDDIEEKTTKFDSESAILPGINLFFGLQRIFISSATSQIEAFQEMKRLGNEDFPGVLEFIFVNKDGELIKSLSDVHPPRELIKGFFQDYKASTLGDSSNLKKNISKYHSFLGPCIGEGFEINVIEGITAASYRMSRAYVYFSNCYSEGMFIALISLTQNLENLELVFRAKWHNFEIPESKTAFIDFEKPIANYSTEFGNLSPHLQYAISELESKPKGGVFAGGHLWKQQKISKRFCRITAIPFPRHVTVEKYSNYLLAFSCLLLCILSYKTWKVISGQDRLNFSIQHKLILLFLYVVGIPTLLLGISSQGFLRERKKVLEAAMYARQEKILMKFDQGLNEGIGNFELRLKEILDSPLHKEDSLLEVAQVRLNMILEKFSPGLCELVDETGSRRFSRKTTWGTNVNKMLEMITSRAPAVLGEINRIPQDQKENSKDQFLNMAAEFMGLNIELIFSSLFQDVGSLNEFKPSGGNLYIMLYPLKDQKRFARFLSFLVWPQEEMLLRYVKDSFEKNRNELLGTTIVAYSDLHDCMVPKDSQFSWITKSLISKTKSKVFTLQTRFQNEIQTFYITGMKGNNLKKFLLFSFTPDTTIREEIYFDSLRLGLFFLVIMCISFAVGSLLLNQFLEPVRNLSLGMKALEQRCFDHKIPIINRDELGRLSDTFNQIMEGLADLEVARVVQDAFFPREILSANGWEVYGTCTPASRVGGDYFDYFLVDENKIAVIVGDVSGHGVSAALVVAMAKALIAHPANEFNPSKIFNMIDKIFSETLKRRKMMTCFFGIIDIIEGKFLASNAGHNYPFILSGEKAEHISFPGFPLGVNSRRKYQVSEINLNENDCMIFYTDGFIEAFDRNGVSIGYPKVKNALPALLKNSAFETENALREWHRSIARPGPLDDDITLVVVQKRLTHPL